MRTSLRTSHVAMISIAAAFVLMTGSGPATDLPGDIVPRPNPGQLAPMSSICTIQQAGAPSISPPCGNVYEKDGKGKCITDKILVRQCSGETFQAFNCPQECRDGACVRVEQMPMACPGENGICTKTMNAAGQCVESKCKEGEQMVCSRDNPVPQGTIARACGVSQCMGQCCTCVKKQPPQPTLCPGEGTPGGLMCSKKADANGRCMEVKCKDGEEWQPTRGNDPTPTVRVPACGVEGCFGACGKCVKKQTQTCPQGKTCGIQPSGRCPAAMPGQVGPVGEACVKEGRPGMCCPTIIPQQPNRLESCNTQQGFACKAEPKCDGNVRPTYEQNASGGEKKCQVQGSDKPGFCAKCVTTPTPMTCPGEGGICTKTMNAAGQCTENKCKEGEEMVCSRDNPATDVIARACGVSQCMGQCCKCVKKQTPDVAPGCTREFPLCSRPSEPGRCPNNATPKNPRTFMLCGEGEHRGGCYACPTSVSPPTPPVPTTQTCERPMQCVPKNTAFNCFAPPVLEGGPCAINGQANAGVCRGCGSAQGSGSACNVTQGFTCSTTMECPSGHRPGFQPGPGGTGRVSCEGGKGYCVKCPTPTETKCVDSDGGKKEFVLGTVSGNNNMGMTYAFADKCVNDKVLKEYFCNGNSMSSMEWTCQYGGCKEGKCAEPSGTRQCREGEVLINNNCYPCNNNGTCDALENKETCPHDCQPQMRGMRTIELKELKCVPIAEIAQYVCPNGQRKDTMGGYCDTDAFWVKCITEGR